MTFGLSLQTFTTLHVVISLIAIAAGLVVAADLLRGASRGGWTAFFLATSLLTCVTGFLFPNLGQTPAAIVGLVTLAALAAAAVALYGRRLAGAGRPVYVIGALLALYLNMFVGVVQAFQKLPPLQALAPTQSEPPFLVAQLALLAALLIVGALALRRFPPVPAG